MVKSMKHIILVICCLSSFATPAAYAQHDVDSAEDRLLSAPKSWAIMAYPLELLTYATTGAPQLSLECWFDISHGFAVNLQPRIIWYPPTDERRTHDWGVGGAVGFYWFSERSLSGPYYGLFAGDVEGFLSTGHGRIYGATATFGYVFGLGDGAVISVGFDIGYWHRSGVLNTGVQWPDIMSFRLGAGYAGGTGAWAGIRK